jgi:hypothetical protein
VLAASCPLHAEGVCSQLRVCCCRLHACHQAPTATAGEHDACSMCLQDAGRGSVGGCCKQTDRRHSHQLGLSAVLVGCCRYHPSLLQFKETAWSVQNMPKPASPHSSSSSSDSGGTGSSSSGPEGCELVYQFAVEDLQRVSDADAARATALAGEGRAAAAAVAAKAAAHRSDSNTSRTAAGGAMQEQEQEQVRRRALRELPAEATHVWQVALPVGDALQRLDPAKVLSVRHWEHPAHTGRCLWGQDR